MKKIRLYLVVLSAMVMFSGCTGVAPEIKVPAGANKNVEVTNKSWGVKFKSQKVTGSERTKFIYPAREVFNTASLVGLSQGYTHMAIINSGINNLSGFPINDWENMEKYLKLYKYKHYNNKAHFTKGSKKLIYNRRVILRISYFKEAVPGLFLWDLEKLKKDT